AVDVVVECLERGDVQHAHAARQGILAPQAVETGEECGEGLAGAGRGENERMPPRRDRRPALPLRRRRLAQGGAEPLAHRRQKEKERIGFIHVQTLAVRTLARRASEGKAASLTRASG